MSTQTPKIVVVTPVKNEAWILDRFLSVTSQFADHIIIADQKSTDASIGIAKNYSKVTLIENKSEQFNEFERQLLLLLTARDLVPESKIILALDADEILAADALGSKGWQTMLQAQPGTVLYFEKPDLYRTPAQCIRRYRELFPLGYVDDGAPHHPKKIHSLRIPIPDYATKLYINEVKFLHYGAIRTNAHIAKLRYYSVIENILGTRNLLARRAQYAPKQDWSAVSELESPQEKWFATWEELGIDMRTIQDQRFYWYDFEILKYFAKHGTQRFWLDDIWNMDWEACRVYAGLQGLLHIPDHPIIPPPLIASMAAQLLSRSYSAYKQLA